jgi:hypothetical protein
VLNTQAAISSLLLRLDHLAAKKLLTGEQVGMLRTLAWSKDFALVESYSQVGVLCVWYSSGWV